MSKQKKIIFVILAVIAVAAIAFFGIRNQMRKSGDDKKSIRIGVILPLTGLYGEMGKSILQAMQISVENVNKELLSQGYKVVLDVEDGKLTANGTISAYRKLLTKKTVAYVIQGDVPCYNIASIASENAQPVLMVGAGAENLPDLSERFFRAWTTTLDGGQKLADFAVKTLRKKKAAVFKVNNNFGDEFAKSVTDAFKKNSGEIIAAEIFDMNAQDVRNQIQKSLQKEPDVIFVLGFGQGYISTLNQLREAGYTGVICTGEVIEDYSTYTNIVDNAKGIYFSATNFNADDKNTNYYGSFVVPYMARTNKKPDAFSAFGYVSIYLIGEAIKNKGIEPKEIEKYLRDVKGLNSIVGPLTYSSSGELSVPMVIKQMQEDGTSLFVEK